MDDKNRKDTIHGYEIKRAVIFENNRGFALAENPNAADPFVTWQFTQEDNGARNYYWGHYFTKKDTATKDYELRIADYAQSYGVSEINAYKYYSTQRPIDIGTFPKTENGPVRFVNFDKREAVEQGQFKAWGYLVYDASLTEKQISDYELRAAHNNPGIVTARQEQTHNKSCITNNAAPKPIAEQLAEAAKQIQHGEPATTDKKPSRDGR